MNPTAGALHELDSALQHARGLILNEVLFSGVVVVDATGAATIHTAVPFASVAARNYSSSLVTVAAAPPQGSAPAQGIGTTRLNAFRFAVVPLAGNMLTIYGAPGATVAVEIYAQLQPPAGNATGVAVAGIAVVQSARVTVAANAPSAPITLPAPVSAGNTLVLVAVTGGVQTVSAIAGDAAFTRRTIVTNATVGDLEIWDRISTIGGETTITVTFSAAIAFGGYLALLEASGVTAFDSAANTGLMAASGPQPAPSIVPAVANDLFVGALASNSNVATRTAGPTGGFTDIGFATPPAAIDSAYLRAVDAAAHSTGWTFTDVQQWQAASAAYRP